MKHLIQFPSGRYFKSVEWFSGTGKGGQHRNTQGSMFSTSNLLEADMYDDIQIAKEIIKGLKSSEIISISSKDLFQYRLKGK